MRLYTARLAPNPRRVAWVMAEKGIDLERVEVDLMRGEHKQPEFRARSSLAHVPVLELDDGTCIDESIAICRYLEALYPEPNLFGRDPEETAVIEMWTRRCELYAANPLMLAVRYTHPALSVLEGADPAAAEKNRLGAEKMLKHLDRRLEGREFIAVDRLSMADIVLACGLDFGRLIKWRPPEALANLGRWREAMKARPAAEAGL
jgi:glutathione S-transferase